MTGSEACHVRLKDGAEAAHDVRLARRIQPKQSEHVLMKEMGRYSIIRLWLKIEEKKTYQRQVLLQWSNDGDGQLFAEVGESGWNQKDVVELREEAISFALEVRYTRSLQRCCHYSL